MELQQRLGLYQVFLRLYENNRELLDEILKLENSENQFTTSFRPRYVHAVVGDGTAYLLTNLLNNQTQQLSQSQGIWLLGRDRGNAIPILDKRLSRRHAAIQYLEGQEFFLIDLNSTNGSFVNGEPVRDRVVLKDGDCIRLGSLAFSFFSSSTTRKARDLPEGIITQLIGKSAENLPTLAGPVTAGLESLDQDEYDSQWTASSSDLDMDHLIALEEDDTEDTDEEIEISSDPDSVVEEKDTSLFLRPKPFREDGEVLDRFLDDRSLPSRDHSSTHP